MLTDETLANEESHYNSRRHLIICALRGNMRKQCGFGPTCGCMSARKTGMSRATNWSVLREYKKADIHPLTYARRAKNGRDNRSTWNLRLKLTNAVARTGKHPVTVLKYAALLSSSFSTLFNQLYARLIDVNVVIITNMMCEDYSSEKVHPSILVKFGEIVPNIPKRAHLKPLLTQLKINNRDDDKIMVVLAMM